VVRDLLKAGANVGISNKAGKKPVDLAPTVEVKLAFEKK
jgi:hypothetical protein